MKRFAVFSGDYYYPLCGFEDYQDSFDTREEAAAFAESWLDGTYDKYYHWTQIVDLTTGEIL